MRRALSLVVLAFGCTPSFDDVTTVKDLRVLGITADTPELLFEGGPLSMAPMLCLNSPTLQALAAELGARLPESFPPVTIRPLVVDPHGGGRAVHYRAVACVSPSGTLNPREGGGGMAPGGVRGTIGRGECPADAPVLGEADVVAGPAGVLPIELELVPTRALVIGAFLGDPLGAVYGLPLTVQLTVSAGEEQVIARKRVIVGAKLASNHLPNRNPVITGLTYRRSQDGPTMPFDLVEPPRVRLGERLFIEPAQGEKEVYPARVGERGSGCVETKPAVEALRYAFFATAGEFSPASTNTEPPIVRGPTNDPHKLSSAYDAPRALLPGQSELVRVWIVNRDERAGSSFVEVALRLVP